MTKKVLNIFFSIIISIFLSILINYYITSEVISSFLFINHKFMNLITILILILQSIAIFSIISIIRSKNLDPITYNLIRICYLSIMIFLLFGRPTTTRQINLNPLDMFSSFSLNSIMSYIFNILFFIPIPFLIKSKNFNKIFLFFIPINFLIEIIQYTFKLGIFDINDIILNLLGVYIGIYLKRKLLYTYSTKSKNA